MSETVEMEVSLVGDNHSLFVNCGGRATGVLFVFVHGVNSDVDMAWKACLDDYLGEKESGYDLLMFHYPSHLWQDGGIDTATESLRKELLSESYKSYRHIHFIVHSTGGLVVKRLLLDERGKMTAAGADFLGGELVTPRCRDIVNLGVPHSGSKEWLRLVALVVYPIYALLAGSGIIARTTISVILFAISVLIYRGSGSAFLWLLWSLASTACAYWLLETWLVARYEKRMALRPPMNPKSDQWFKRGVCRIWRELSIEKSRLIAWEDEWQGYMRELDKLGYPRPVSTDILGASDVPVERARGFRPETIGPEPTDREPAYYTDEESPYLHRGSHSGVKGNLAVISFLRQKIQTETSTDPHDVLKRIIADWTMIIGRSADRQFGVVGLVSHPFEVPGGQLRDYQTFRGSQLGSQLETRAGIEKALANGAKRLLLTGDTGVGKTAVLRSIGSRLAARSMRGTHADPLPISFPLYRINTEQGLLKIFPERDGLLTLDIRALCEWWLGWLQSLIRSEALRKHWHSDDDIKPLVEAVTWEAFKSLIDRQDTVFLMDGVDDLNAKLPGAAEALRVAATHLQDLNWMDFAPQETARPDLPVKVVYGIRSSYMATGFADHASEFEVARLTPDEVTRFVAEQAAREGSKDKEEAQRIADMLLQYKDHPHWKILSTPLVLSELSLLSAAHLCERSLASRGEVLQTVLRAQIERTTTLCAHNWEVCMDSLTLIAHAFYVFSIQAADVDTIVKQVEELLALDWSELEPPEGYRKACDRDFCQALLDRTIFVRVGNLFRLGHREWAEFLEARYLREAMIKENAIALSRRPGRTGIYLIAGDLIHELPELTVSSAFVQKIEELSSAIAHPIAKQIPIGNFLGIFGHCRCAVEDAAVDLLLGLYVNRAQSPLVQLVAVQTLGYRALRGPEGTRHDAFQGLIRQQLARRLENQYAEGSGHSLIDATAYLIHGEIALDRNWPASDPIFEHREHREFDGTSRMRDEVFQDAIRYVASPNGSRDSFVSSDFEQQMQLVFLNLLDETTLYPMKGLACATYTATLVAAITRGAAAPLVRAHLPHYLSGDRSTQIRSTFENFNRSKYKLNRMWDIYKQHLDGENGHRTDSAAE